MFAAATAVLALVAAQFETDEILPSDQPATSISSRAFGKSYVSRITGAHFARSPKWEDDAENPPLSAKKARDLAEKMKDSLVKDSKKWKWHLPSLELCHMFARWFWVAKYHATFQGAYSGPPQTLYIVVMMDGTVIQPDVTERKIKELDQETDEAEPKKIQKSK
jgi:hypothetical protein